jgi:hypothetical protein
LKAQWDAKASDELADLVAPALLQTRKQNTTEQGRLYFHALIDLAKGAKYLATGQSASNDQKCLWGTSICYYTFTKKLNQQL